MSYINLISNLIAAPIPFTKLRKNIRKKVILKLEDIALDYEIKKILKSIEIPKQPQTGQNGTPKIIWQFWYQGFNQAPPIVKCCLLNTQKFAEQYGYRYVLLEESNLSYYLDLNPIIRKKLNKGFTITSLSDLIRGKLLYLFGGIWLDATLLITGDFDSILQQSNRILYVRSELSDQKERVKFHEFDPIYFNWNKSSRIKWLNSIIKAPQYDPLFFLLDKLLTHYWLTN